MHLVIWTTLVSVAVFGSPEFISFPPLSSYTFALLLVYFYNSTFKFNFDSYFATLTFCLAISFISPFLHVDHFLQSAVFSSLC